MSLHNKFAQQILQHYVIRFINRIHNCVFVFEERGYVYRIRKSLQLNDLTYTSHHVSCLYRIR